MANRFERWFVIRVFYLCCMLFLASCGDGKLRLGYFADSNSESKPSTVTQPNELPDSGPVEEEGPFVDPETQGDVSESLPGATGSPEPSTQASPSPSTLPSSPAAPRTSARPEPQPGGPLPTRGEDDERPGSSSDPERERILNKVLDLTNGYRIENGLAPLTLNAELSRAAQEYAERMGEEVFFDHVAPDGTRPRDRISAMGYQPQACGENLALGYKTPEQTVHAWIRSPSHQANLLNKDYTEIGLGYAVGKSRQYGDQCAYWVQEFATPRNRHPSLPHDGPEAPSDAPREKPWKKSGV
ncbi:MAG: CAP domain-containing protein [Bdellovibrionota bacterium]